MTGLRHFGLVVCDLDIMQDFYCRLLGLEVRARADESGPFIDSLLGFPGTRVTTVKMAGDDGSPTLLELLRFASPASEARRQVGVNTPGPTHVAFTVGDIDGLHRDMASKGIAFISAPMISPDGRAKVSYCRDPEGNFVELVEMIA